MKSFQIPKIDAFLWSIPSFYILQDEAFALWQETWASIYPEGSRSKQVIQEIHDNYYLVNLVDNQYPRETVLWDIVDEMLKEAGKM